MSDYDPDTRPTIACPNPKCGHSIIIPPLIGEMGDRHPKWQRVEPGTLIPAGQPYMIEYDEPLRGLTRNTTRAEYVQPDRDTIAGHPYFIDSSWKPPLVLPTEPTWGIAVHVGKGRLLGYWHLEGDEFWRVFGQGNQANQSYRAHNIADFIPLTDEQVQRIEAVR